MTVTFISGATGGIGKAFSFACAKRGYDLFLTGRSEEKLSALKSDIEKAHGVSVVTFACDLSDESERKALYGFARGKGLIVERIINVAGVDTQLPFTEYSEEKLLFQIRVNVEATLSVTKNLLELKKGNAEVITISSMSGVSPMPYFAVYSGTKALLSSVFTSLHYELKGDGVKVTTVLPGGVYTRPDINEQIKQQGIWGKLSAKTPEFVAEKSLKAVKRNKIKYIPGFFNRVLNFFMKITPKRIVLSFIAKRWKNQRKDAFK